MAGDQTDAISALLSEAEEAHGAYEATELNGVYDQDWARWYAIYAVEHGIGDSIGRSVTAGELTQFFADSYAEFGQADPKPTEPWAVYTARRIAADM
jgi:hypothetical protein